MTDTRTFTEEEEAQIALEALKRIFAFGVPGGRSTIQRRIGKYLDGDATALDGAPTIKARINEGVDLGRLLLK